MTNIDRMYKILDDRWQDLKIEYAAPYDDEDKWEWTYKPYSFNVSKNGYWATPSQIQYTFNGFSSKKPNQPKLPESYPKEDLNMLFGLDGG